MPEETKQCVACAEEIKRQAGLCRFCGTNQNDVLYSESSSALPAAAPQVSKQKVGRGPNLRDVLRSSWLLSGGFLLFVAAGFHPSGIYGPWQPVAVFATGVFAPSLLLFIVINVVMPSEPSSGQRSLRRGSLAWSSLSLAVSLFAWSVSFDFYETNQENSSSAQESGVLGETGWPSQATSTRFS